MFIISNNQTGDVIERQEEPNYVHIGENGCWQSCGREDALAVSVNGNLYKLLTVDYGDDPLPEGNWVHTDPGDPASDIETAHVYVESLGKILDRIIEDVKAEESRGKKQQTDIQLLGVKQDCQHDEARARLAEIETAMCETTAVSEERIDAVEQAICESSEQSEGRMDVIELAVCESAALADERIAAIEQALCELAAAMEG